VPALGLSFPKKAESYGFGETLVFSVKGAGDPSKLVVRARYIPPTGHDAGGPQFSTEIAALVTAKQCLACHQVDKASVGPAYLDVAMRYRGDAAAAGLLQAKLKSGGGGVWGEIPMPPQAAVTDAEGETLIRAILGLADGMAETRGLDEGKLELAPAPAGAASGGAWEITAEAPGFTTAKARIPAK